MNLSGAIFQKGEGRAVACHTLKFPIVAIQESGLDGFWIHRVLQGEGIESHVVDPACIAISRRRRRAKTDRMDGARRCFARCWVKARRTAGVRDGQGVDGRGRGPPLARVDAVGANLGRKPGEISADAGYCSEDNLLALRPGRSTPMSLPGEPSIRPRPRARSAAR